MAVVEENAYKSSEPIWSGTYGELPPREEFLASVAERIEEIGYPMEFQPGSLGLRVTIAAITIPEALTFRETVGNHGPRRITLYTAKDLYNFLRRLTEASEFMDDAEQLAASILSTLGYEWV